MLPQAVIDSRIQPDDLVGHVQIVAKLENIKNVEDTPDASLEEALKEVNEGLDRRFEEMLTEANGTLDPVVKEALVAPRPVSEDPNDDGGLEPLKILAEQTEQSRLLWKGSENMMGSTTHAKLSNFRQRVQGTVKDYLQKLQDHGCDLLEKVSKLATAGDRPCAET